MSVSLSRHRRAVPHFVAPLVRRDGAARTRTNLDTAGPPVAGGPDLVAYRRGLAAIRATLEAERAMPLQPGSESRLLAHPTPPPRGTIVMLHGFSAGTWQFEDMARTFFERGYNVYVPRLPGHGFRRPDGSEDATRLLGSRNWAGYHAYAERVHSQVKALGGPVHLMGLSGGANVALDIAAHHPDVKGAVLFAPFLAPRSRFARAGFAVASFLDRLTGGFAGRLLDRLPFGWGEGGRAAARAWGRPGHWDMKLGNAYGLYRHGQTLVADAAKIKVPLQFFTTAIDDAADLGAIRRVHERSGGAGRNGFYHFPASEDVPHPMVHWRENGHPDKIARLTDRAVAFVLQGKRSERP